MSLFFSSTGTLTACNYFFNTNDIRLAFNKVDIIEPIFLMCKGVFTCTFSYKS